MNKTGLVIHGGAGAHFGGLTESESAARHQALRDIAARGQDILQRGGGALDAVTEAVRLLEDCPLFNAGKGAVFAANGVIELDACVMDGRTGACGGVSAAQTIKNPVLAARAVMEQSPHSLLCGRGAEEYAAGRGLDIVDNDYFHTLERRQGLEEALQKQFRAEAALGTVGAVALDRQGHLAAATSTGGLTAKLPGRVSDSSIAGAGTWAADGLCALSCTGTGDIFIRNATARDVACLMEYKGFPLAQAAAEGLRKVRAAGGAGGIIGIDAEGGVVMDFNTSGMCRGWTDESGQVRTAIL